MKTWGDTKLYVSHSIVFKQEFAVGNTKLLFADNEPDALAVAYKDAQSKYPRDKGFGQPSVVVDEVSPLIIIKAYQLLKGANNEGLDDGSAAQETDPGK
mgnify:CR=1 FL=1